MNGIHDMGGMTDFGPIRREAHEPVFHAEWERRVFGLIRQIIDNRYNWDEFRFAIERIDPVVYLSSSYYERWLTALERYLLEKGVFAENEMPVALAGWSVQPGSSLPDTERAAATTVQAPKPGASPRFAAGDLVNVGAINPIGHTRLPRYVRGKCGRIERVLGAFTFPDTNALQLGERREPVYAVRFTARVLWGEQASKRDSVCVDLWESYLEVPDTQ